MLIYNATIFPMDDPHDPSRSFLGYIRFEEGVIVQIAEGAPSKMDEEALDAEGAILTPGLIDAHSHLGLIGDALGFEADDVNEDSDPITPHLRALDAINPFDRGFADARQAGVTTVVTGPGSANTIGGVMAAVKTAGVCIDDMLVRADVAMKFALGENPKSCYHQKDTGPETRMASAALIREALQKATRYLADVTLAQTDPDNNSMPDYDAKLEALIPVLKGEMQAHFHAHRADDICTALRIAREFSLDYRLVHCTEGHLVADVLKKEQAQALLGPFFLSRSKPELAKETVENPTILQQAGVDFAIVTDHPELPQQYLLLSACQAVKHGLDRGLALAAITCTPARILGLADRIGSLKVGLDADLVLFDGDPFDFYTRARLVFINGKAVFSA